MKRVLVCVRVARARAKRRRVASSWRAIPGSNCEQAQPVDPFVAVN